MNFVAVFVGGGLGSLCRYGIGIWIARQNWTNFPLGTFISNVLACLFMAITLYYFKEKIQNNYLMPLLIGGFCGGFSTFSALSLETAQLLQQGDTYWAILNIGISLLFGLGIFFVFKSA